MNLDGIIEDLPNRTTPLCKATFEKMCNAILEAAFPIGKTEIFYDNEDHSNYLGFTWERTLEGVFPVGIKSDDEDFNTIDKTGGSKYLQKHNHLVTNKYGNVYSGQEFPVLAPLNNPYAPSTSNFSSADAGEGDSGNLPPYKVVAYWKRVA